MDLSKLSDQELMSKTKNLVKEESVLLVKILHHIKEIDRRRLYADFKQPGLLELVMTELGYSRDQALRRIQAMRMMRENPVVEKKLEAGDLNLTTIGIVQTLFSSEKREGKPLSLERKIDVIERVAGKSTREAQKIVFSLSSVPLRLNEKIKMIASDLYELTASVDEKTVRLLDQLKGLLAHSHPNISNGDLIRMLAEMGLKELQVAKKVTPARSVVSPRLDLSSKAVKALPKAEIQRQIWQRDQHRCTNCKSTFALQEDHRWPKAKGGPYTLKNMRLLCRSCNQRAAVKHFGVQKIEGFLISTD